ncbi:hypothetical protein HAX54_028221 [Datura stramonium]|uniref:Uncharacterized protein n=1 Tax=Datura stramonium TaxID=4076 RepID=A0ABS8V6J1_DATST|nr:hypothetical protein [Datura stramonium]
MEDRVIGTHNMYEYIDMYDMMFVQLGVQIASAMSYCLEQYRCSSGIPTVAKPGQWSSCRCSVAEIECRPVFVAKLGSKEECFGNNMDH